MILIYTNININYYTMESKSPLTKRIQKEHTELINVSRKYKSDPAAENARYYLDESEKTNIQDFIVYLRGPSGTPYVGGIYKLSFKLDNTFPYQPPKIKFVTPVYHPNIDEDGNICLDTLKQQWSPALCIDHVILSISALLDKPNPDDPLSPSIAKEYKNNYKLFLKNAIKSTKENTKSTKDPHRSYMSENEVIEKVNEENASKIKTKNNGGNNLD